MKQIKLTQGKVALVDDEDFDYLNKFNWHAYKSKTSSTWYARRNHGSGVGKQITILMHREIMGMVNPIIFIDHKDRDGLNNQKINLRECTSSQNPKNCKRKGSSVYAGVSYHKANRNWVAGISMNGDGKRKHIGSFQSEQEAAMAYDEMAKKYFGEFANLNFKE